MATPNIKHVNRSSAIKAGNKLSHYVLHLYVQAHQRKIIDFSQYHLNLKYQIFSVPPNGQGNNTNLNICPKSQYLNNILTKAISFHIQVN